MRFKKTRFGRYKPRINLQLPFFRSPHQWLRGNRDSDAWSCELGFLVVLSLRWFWLELWFQHRRGCPLFPMIRWSSFWGCRFVRPAPWCLEIRVWWLREFEVVFIGFVLRVKYVVCVRLGLCFCSRLKENWLMGRKLGYCWALTGFSLLIEFC